MNSRDEKSIGKRDNADQPRDIDETIDPNEAIQDTLAPDSGGEDTGQFSVTQDGPATIDSSSTDVQDASGEPAATVAPGGEAETIDPSATLESSEAASDETGEFVTSPGTDFTMVPGSSSADQATGAFSLNASADPDATQYSSPGQAAAGRSSSPSKIGDYKVLGVLGRGGMGVVYRARHGKLGREVALKMVLAGAHATPDQLQRFISEAQAVAHLQHPNIVQIFEVNESDGLPYFSLEFVDGSPLDARLKESMLGDREAAKTMAVICHAMQYAHDNGILHRDLKPANVLLTQDGSPKITDFGLAKKLEDDDDSASTRTGTVMGTPSYMSPEQAQGLINELGPATDQYSLGAMLYEFVVGRPPFLGSKPIETIMQVVRDEPVPPRSIRASCPIDLETICLKALSKEPEKRYSSCAAMADDLQRYLDGKPIEARPVSKVEAAWRWCKRNPVVASLSATAASLLVAVAISSTWFAYSLSAKNTMLSEQKGELERTTKQLGEKNTELNSSNKALAETNTALESSNEENVRRSERLQAYVQSVFTSIGGLNVLESPRAKTFRDDLLERTLPLMDEIISELPEGAQATPTKMAGLYQLSLSYGQQQMGQQAEKTLLKLIDLAEERIELKNGSDAARNNLGLFLARLADVRLKLNRDFKSSLAAARRAVDLAQSMIDEPKAAADGKGMMAPYASKALLIDFLTTLGSNYYRMGDSASGAPHYERAHELRNKVIASMEDGSAFKDLDERIQLPSEPVRQRTLAALKRQIPTGNLARAAILFRLGKVDESRPLYKKAYRDANDALAQDPTNPLYIRQAVGIGGMWAEFLAQSGNEADAIPIFRRASELGDKLLAEDPKNADFMRTASIAYYRLSQWLDDSEEAKQFGEKALAFRRELFEGEPDNSKYLIELLPSIARTGEIPEAEKIAKELTEEDKIDSELLIEIAKTYSLCASRSTGEAREQYLELAKASLERAVEFGLRDLEFYKREKDLQTLTESFDLSSLQPN